MTRNIRSNQKITVNNNAFMVFGILLMLLTFSCNSTKEQNKIPVYAWLGGPGESTDKEIQENFNDLKAKGIDVLMYNGGQNPDVYKRVGKIAKSVGLGFHTWIPTMVQGHKDELKPEWYAVNRNGESAYDKPAYVPHYTFLCPSKKGTQEFLSNMYRKVAAVEEVDAIHLDYIRFPDVILARGLWEKYGLVMDKEYPPYDYCYCDECTSDFKEKSGIDILNVEDPTQVEEWKQFRYDLITKIVSLLTEVAHSEGKQINGAVFPGPNSVAKKIVRQEWDKWSLDAYFPMNYNDFYLEDTKWIGEVTKEAVTSLNNKKPVISGLFICPNPANKTKENDPENHGLLPEELEDAIRESMENGAAGICLFTPGRMTKEHWEAFEKAIHKKY
ncbi:hypothetical protein RXV94_10205 [Yeosuana sp. MJ-SS3]|uniref:DUF4015 domain-containing protein n=1 Tax=Gilvirhabdus luticola TaxID=3079858 RepID=A0ABU3U7Z7_9FLAO|nr:hypothetical protein [Yeosuana sp. MJ-SS3]MDU8886532.1 hypothetical protein [Yeosuana sp. MJ-SS3]